MKRALAIWRAMSPVERLIWTIWAATIGLWLAGLLVLIGWST